MQEIHIIAGYCAVHLATADNALSTARIDRYLAAAKGDRTLALRYYIWNVELCEAFYTPLHFAEVAVRNGILRAVVARFGIGWPSNPDFRKHLETRFVSDLDQAIAEERKQHVAAMTHEHIASALTFAFWDHLCTKRFRPLLWAKGIKPYFPHFEDNNDLYKLQAQIMSVRQWRNRIAHHKTVFDKSPTAKHNDILAILSWISPDLRAFVINISRVSQVIQRRPTPLPSRL